jgi:peptidoglycan/LPS O-acetylase OafA/YrhL
LIRVLAAATFSIYLFHLPLLWFLCASPVYHRNQPIDLILAFTLVLTICFALSRVTEAKKDGWRRLLARLQSAS